MQGDMYAEQHLIKRWERTRNPLSSHSFKGMWFAYALYGGSYMYCCKKKSVTPDPLISNLTFFFCYAFPNSYTSFRYDPLRFKRHHHFGLCCSPTSDIFWPFYFHFVCLLKRDHFRSQVVYKWKCGYGSLVDWMIRQKLSGVWDVRNTRE